MHKHQNKSPREGTLRKEDSYFGAFKAMLLIRHGQLSFLLPTMTAVPSAAAAARTMTAVVSPV